MFGKLLEVAMIVFGPAAQEIVWKATAWNMPLAVGAGAGCGTDGNLAEIARRYNVLFYFWAPDAMLNDLEPACRLSAFKIFSMYCSQFLKHRVWNFHPAALIGSSTPFIEVTREEPPNFRLTRN